MIIKGKKYLYDLKLGNQHLCCEILVKSHINEEYREYNGIIMKIFKKDGFQYINVGDEYSFEEYLLKEMINPNEIMKDIV